MNLRDLMNKLDTIAETDASGDEEARFAAYIKKQEDVKAKSALAQKIQAMIKSQEDPSARGAGHTIDPKNGIIFWSTPYGGETPRPEPVRMDQITNLHKDIKQLLDSAGVSIVPSAAATGSGWNKFTSYGAGNASVPLDQVKLLQQGKLPSAVTTDPVGPKPPGPKPLGPTPPEPKPLGPTTRPRLPGQDIGSGQDVAQLNALVARLDASLGGDVAPQPSPNTDPIVKPPPGPGPVSGPEKTTAQKVGIGAGGAAGALAAWKLARRAGAGVVGQGLAGLTGGAAGAMGVNALQEGIQYNSSIARSLTESLGYEFQDEQLDEYSMSQLGKDAGDFGRGAWNGVTLGAGDNIAAGVKSAFGPGTYKDELAKQAAASKEAETRSPWLYGAGNVAGALAVPVPGALAGRAAMGAAKTIGATGKLAQGGAKVAGIVGANLAAQKAVDVAKQKSDLNTFVGPGGDKRIGALQQAIGLVGAQIDGKMGPNTAKAIMAYQKGQGLPVTGKADPATMSKAGLAENRVHTVAEDIRSMQQKLAMIESGQWSLEEDTVYRVWLRPDNTVIDDNGVLITDDELLENIQWDPKFLAEFDYGMKYIGKGYDALKGAAGKMFGAGEKKAAQVATKPPAGTTNTVYKQSANNANAARAELPKAPAVTKDLAGNAITKPGELGGGSIAAARAQAAADDAVNAGRAASKELGGTMNAMVKGGGDDVAKAADDAVAGAGAFLSKAGAKVGDDVVGAGANAADDAVKGAGAALSKAGAKVGDDVIKAGDNVAGVAGKELSAAERAAASAAARAAKRSGRLTGWIKANPKLAAALGLAGAAAIGAGTVAALGGFDDEGKPDPANGPATDPATDPANGPTTTGSDVAPSPTNTTTSELTPEQKELIKKIRELMRNDWGDDKDWLNSTMAAQAVLDKAEKRKQAEAAAIATASEKKAGGIAAQPTGTTKPASVKPGDLYKDSKGVNRDVSGKEYKQNPATKQFEPVTESDNELARWLRIARG